MKLNRHARACRGHPRLPSFKKQDVDGRDKPGHDGGEDQAQIIAL
jgi:hypothetical protein